MNEFPKLHFLDMPYRVEKLSKSTDANGTELLLVHPSAQFEATHLSPRDAWKYEHQRARLRKRGILLTAMTGRVGQLWGVKVEEVE